MLKDIKYTKEKKNEQNIMILFLILTAFFVHIICALFYLGHGTDVTCFTSWANRIFEVGPSEFYNKDVFTDYPPGYMYILWVVGAVQKIFGIDFAATPLQALPIKMPAILCDLGIGYVIYLIAKKYTKNTMALVASAVYMFNPVIILNSSLWGQVDSVFTLYVLLMCYLITEKQLTASYFVFAIGILIKPQTLIFTPVLIYAIIDQVFLNDFSVKRMLKELGFGFAAIAGMFLLAWPYGISAVVSQYIDTLGSYEYATVNAYNFWALFGKNWVDQTSIFFFLPCKTWGTIAIVATVGLSAWFCFKNKDSESKYYMTGAFIVTSMFMTSVRMHERYMYPALALFLAAALVKRHIRMFYVFAALCFVHFLNTAHVLFNFENSYSDKTGIQVMSLLSVCVFVYMCVVMIKDGFRPRQETYEETKMQKNDRRKK